MTTYLVERELYTAFRADAKETSTVASGLGERQAEALTARLDEEAGIADSTTRHFAREEKRMKELAADLWEVEADLRIITTNGAIRKDGAAIMGRGCALEAKERMPGLEYKLGRLLDEHGNRVMRLCRHEGVVVASFPVKRHWREEAMPELIRRSAGQLVALADKFGCERIVLPRPGCGNGRLSWEEIRPILAGILDDRFTVVHK